MNHVQAILMKSSRVSDLNTPWEQVLHLASRRVFPKRHTIDVSNTESPYFYYILSGTVRLAYVGPTARNGRSCTPGRARS